MKRFVLFLFCLTLILGLTGVVYSAEDSMEWEIQDGTLYIRGSGKLPDFAPGGGPWIDQSENITAVVVEEGITALGRCFFQGLTNAKTITLPSTLTGTGSGGAFIGCTALEEITIPEGVKGLSLYLFEDCTALKTVKLPSTLKTIAEGAFQGCSALEAIAIPQGVTTLPDYVFNRCTSLAQVSLPEGLTSIGVYTFARCQALKTIDLPQSLTALGEFAFGESGLTEVHLPDNITSLQQTFRGCTQLAEVTLPANLKTLGQYTLENCDGITQLHIPASVESLESDAAADCDKLERVFFYADKPALDFPFGGNFCEVYFPADRVDVWLSGDLHLNSNVTVLMADMDNICDEHSFSDTAEVVRPNSCLYTGLQSKRCLHCSAARIEILKAAGHFYSVQTVPADENTAGYLVYICTECGWRMMDFTNPNNLSYADAILFMQNVMSLRDNRFNVRFWSEEPLDTEKLHTKMLDDAMTYNGIPCYGDYLRSHTALRAGKVSYDGVENGKYWYYCTFELSYWTTLKQEEAITFRVHQIMEELDLEGKSDLEKVLAIENYIVNNVSYDYTYSRYTAYNALLQSTCVCQGYAALTCRLFAEAGLDCRYISGNTPGGGHAWNLVKLDGVYYHVDSTWNDDPVRGMRTNYFLKGTEEFFLDHTPDSEFRTEEFNKMCPISKENYPMQLGACGKSAQWYLNPDGTLVIFGKGKAECRNEWRNTQTPVRRIVIGEGITELDYNFLDNLDELESVFFMGDKPRISRLVLGFEDFTFYYSKDNPSWSIRDWEIPFGSITWKPYERMGRWGDNIYWVYNADNTIEFFGSGHMLSNHDLQPWLEHYRLRIEKAIFHQGITSISRGALSECPALTEVVLPQGLVSIGEYAFMNDGQLAAINLPEGLETIEDRAFTGCNALEKLTFPKSLTTLGEGVFSYCTGLTELVFKGNGPKIGDYCFGTVYDIPAYYSVNKSGWTEDVLLHYGGYLNWIGIEAIRLGELKNTSGFAGQTLYVDLDAIGENLSFTWYMGKDGVFTAVSTAPDLALPITGQMDYTEFYCLVTDPEGNTASTDTAALKLYDTVLEDSPKELSVDYNVFCDLVFIPQADCLYTITATDCSYMTGYFYELNGAFLGVCEFTEDGFTYTCQMEKDKPYLITINPSSMEFRDLSFFVTVKRAHDQLQETLLETPTCTEKGIAKYTCGLCADSWVQEVQPRHEYANGVCPLCGKKEPDVVKQLSDTLWWELTGDTLRIYGEGAMPDYEIFFRQPWLDYQTVIKNVVIEEGITHIGRNAFSGCSIETLRLPKSLVSIGESAFEYNWYLKELQLPEGLQVIGPRSFYGCGELTVLTIPSTVTEIGNEAFALCQLVTQADFRGNAPTIGADAFQYVYANATFPENDPTWTEDAQNQCPGFTWTSAVHSHSYTTAITEPTCTEAGFVTYTCYCGYCYRETDKPAVGHCYIAEVTEASCTTDGYTTYTCTCGDSYQVPGVDAYGHAMTNGCCIVCGAQTGALPGDIDCSGTVDTEDVVAMLLYISMPDMFPLQSGVNADLTGEGIMDTEDAVKLLLHISMPDMFPL